VFEAIAFRNQPGPGPLIDAGALAEALLFYGRVAVIANSATLKALFNSVPPYVVLRLMEAGRLEIHYLADQVGVQSSGPLGRRQHQLVAFHSPQHQIESAGPREFIDATGRTSQGKLAARKFTQLLKPLDHRTFGRDRVVTSMLRQESTQAAVQGLLEVFAPRYAQANRATFQVEHKGDGLLVVHGNVDYDRVNEEYNQVVSPKHSSISEAYLLSFLQDAHEELHFAATLRTELATDPVRQRASMVIVDADISRIHKSEGQLSAFSEFTLDSASAIREAVNSHRVPFVDVVELVEKADKFKAWIRDRPADANLLKEYHAAATADTFASKLPTKATRWSILSTVSVGIDAMGAGGLGTALGAAIGALDQFLIDRLIQGWRPHHFVERDLRPTVLPKGDERKEPSGKP
jgi:hypothetical protein